MINKMIRTRIKCKNQILSPYFKKEIILLTFAYNVQDENYKQCTYISDKSYRM